MDEAGVTGFNLDAWAGLVAPAGTPAPIVTKLNAALRNVIDSPDVQAKFKTIGFEGFSSTPGELGAFIKAQLGVGKDGQGRRHQSGLTLELEEGFRRQSGVSLRRECFWTLFEVKCSMEDDYEPCI